MEKEEIKKKIENLGITFSLASLFFFLASFVWTALRFTHGITIALICAIVSLWLGKNFERKWWKYVALLSFIISLMWTLASLFFHFFPIGIL